MGMNTTSTATAHRDRILALAAVLHEAAGAYSACDLDCEQVDLLAAAFAHMIGEPDLDTDDAVDIARYRLDDHYR